MQTFTRKRAAMAIAAVAIATMSFSAAAMLAGSNPPGNNGTVKIDGQPFDTAPNNEPHVGCIFEVDFYGFDRGQLFADVTFEAQPPSGRGVILTDRVFIGEDDNSGGGSQAGLDAQREYSLQGLLGAFDAHAKQGYHVKLTVNADGSQGADTKHKVFWVTDCDEPDPDPSPNN